MSTITHSKNHPNRYTTMQKITKLYAKIALLLLISSTSTAATEIAQHTDNISYSYDLVLAGGGLRTCSSMSQRNCNTANFPDTAKTANTYEFNRKNVDKFKNTAVFTGQADSAKQKFNAIFEHVNATPVTLTGGSREIAKLFKQAADDFAGDDFFYGLPNQVYYAVQDYFEVASTKTEIVDLTDNKSKQVTEIYTRFVEIADSKRQQGHDDILRIGVMTSSSRDPLSNRDYYVGIFESAAAIALPNQNVEVLWIPLSKSLQQAMVLTQQGFDGCARLGSLFEANGSFNRDAVYPHLVSQQRALCEQPQLLADMLNSLHGLFINGGDQSLSLAALTNSDGSDNRWMQIIRNKLATDGLVLGGTSAGTAVQGGGIFKHRAVPMISNGDPEVAFIRGAFALEPPPFGCEKDNSCPHGLIEDDLTFNPRGGIGTFPLGIVDTHFSERDREARLALLAMHTKTQFGFGVDEATALLVNLGSQQIDMEVVGEGGVFIVDAQNGIYKTQSGKNQIVAMSHFINHGDKARYSYETQDMSFQLIGQITTATKPLPGLEKGIWRNEVRKHCGTPTFHRWQAMKIAFLVNPNEETRFAINETGSASLCSYTDLLFGMEN